MKQKNTAGAELAEIRASARAQLVALDAKFRTVALPERKPPSSASRLSRLRHAVTPSAPPISVQAKAIGKSAFDALQGLLERVKAVEAGANQVEAIAKALNGREKGLPEGLPVHVRTAMRTLVEAHQRGLSNAGLVQALEAQVEDLRRETKHTNELVARCHDACRLGAAKQISKLYESAAAKHTGRQADQFLNAALVAAESYRRESDHYAAKWFSTAPKSKAQQVARGLRAGEISMQDLIAHE